MLKQLGFGFNSTLTKDQQEVREKIKGKLTNLATQYNEKIDTLITQANTLKIDNGTLSNEHRNVVAKRFKELLYEFKNTEQHSIILEAVLKEDAFRNEIEKATLDYESNTRFKEEKIVTDKIKSVIQNSNLGHKGPLLFTVNQNGEVTLNDGAATNSAPPTHDAIPSDNNGATAGLHAGAATNSLPPNPSLPPVATLPQLVPSTDRPQPASTDRPQSASSVRTPAPPTHDAVPSDNNRATDGLPTQADRNVYSVKFKAKEFKKKGLGLSLCMDNAYKYRFVDYIYPDSLGKTLGIKMYDYLISVNDLDLKDMTIQDITKILSDKMNMDGDSTVTLKLHPWPPSQEPQRKQYRDKLKTMLEDFYKQFPFETREDVEYPGHAIARLANKHVNSDNTELKTKTTQMREARNNYGVAGGTIACTRRRTPTQRRHPRKTTRTPTRRRHTRKTAPRTRRR